MVVWFACAVLIFVLDRLTAAGTGGIWESDDPVVSVLAYLILILAGPFIVVGFLLWFAWDSASRLWRKPSVATVAEKRPESEGSVLVDLVRRRAGLDPRLAGSLPQSDIAGDEIEREILPARPATRHEHALRLATENERLVGLDPDAFVVPSQRRDIAPVDGGLAIRQQACLAEQDGARAGASEDGAPLCTLLSHSASGSYCPATLSPGLTKKSGMQTMSGFGAVSKS